MLAGTMLVGRLGADALMACAIYGGQRLGNATRVVVSVQLWFMVFARKNNHNMQKKEEHTKKYKGRFVYCSTLPVCLWREELETRFQQPTFQQFTSKCLVCLKYVVILNVSSEFLKCRLLKWLSDHPMTNNNNSWVALLVQRSLSKTASLFLRRYLCNTANCTCHAIRHFEESMH